jgi:hypothetical protein
MNSINLAPLLVACLCTLTFVFACDSQSEGPSQPNPMPASDSAVNPVSGDGSADALAQLSDSGDAALPSADAAIDAWGADAKSDAAACRVTIATSGSFSNLPAPGVECGPVGADAPVRCGTSENCCFAIAPQCSPAGAGPGCYGTLTCDGPEDCGQDEQCSVMKAVGVYWSSACVPKVPCVLPACHTAADCASGESCCAPQSLKVSYQKFGVCKSTCQ